MTVSTAPLQAPGARRDVLDALPHGLLLTDADDRVVYANPRMSALAGCPSRALVGLPAAEVLPATASTWLRPPSDAAAESAADGIELELLRRDRGRLWVLVHAAPLAGGGWVRLVADIGERKHAESDQARLQQALTHAAREWQLTFDAVETPLLVTEPDGRVARLNRAAQRLAGHDFPELIGRPLAELGAGEPWRTAAELVRATAQRSGPRSATAHEPSPRRGAQMDAGTGAGTGACRVWDLAASVSERPDEGGERIIVVLRDVTGLVELQESLRKSEVMSALGTLVAGVAHEVRNPLFGLSAVLDAFESRFGDQEAQRSYLDLMHEQVRRLSTLMQQLLDYGKPQALEPEPADPAEVAAEAAAGCAALGAERGVEVAVEPAGAVPAVAMDRARMVQAFRNLIDNAILHTPRGGRVRVAIAAAPDPERRGASGRNGRPARGRVAVRVEDSGPGIAEEDQLRVFDPFFSRRRGGTGLGLSIVLRVVEQHGGRITAGNLPEGGAVMELLLPVAETEDPAAEPEQ